MYEIIYKTINIVTQDGLVNHNIEEKIFIADKIEEAYEIYNDLLHRNEHLFSIRLNNKNLNYTSETLEFMDAIDVIELRLEIERLSKVITEMENI